MASVGVPFRSLVKGRHKDVEDRRDWEYFGECRRANVGSKMSICTMYGARAKMSLCKTTYLLLLSRPTNRRVITSPLRRKQRPIRKASQVRKRFYIARHLMGSPYGQVLMSPMAQTFSGRAMHETSECAALLLTGMFAPSLGTTSLSLRYKIQPDAKGTQY